MITGERGLRKPSEGPAERMLRTGEEFSLCKHYTVRGRNDADDLENRNNSNVLKDWDDAWDSEDWNNTDVFFFFEEMFE